MKVISLEEMRVTNSDDTGNVLGVEAKEWFGKTRNESSFASNAFDNAEAEELVNSLYDAGAELVIVGEILSEEYRIEDEGDPYSATLFIKVCKECESAVKDVIIDCKPDEYSIEKDGMLRIWWD